MNGDHLSQDGAFQADQAEFRAMQDGVSALESAAIDEIVSDEVMDEGELESEDAPFVTPEYEKKQIGIASLTGKAADVVKYRRDALGKDYPFEVDNTSVVHIASHSGFYEFCLAACLATSAPNRRYQRLTRHFERVVCSLMTAYWGEGSMGARFGWPREGYFDDPPPAFSERVAWLRQRCGFHSYEWLLHEHPELAAPYKRAKDARIDIVVRRSVTDRLAGGLTVLVQCGCGKEDVRDSATKHEALSPEWLRSFFSTTCIPSPTIAFATAHHIANSNAFLSRQYAANCLFVDRMRLMRIFEAHSSAITFRDLTWMRLLTEWVKAHPPSSTLEAELPQP